MMRRKPWGAAFAAVGLTTALILCGCTATSLPAKTGTSSPQASGRTSAAKAAIARIMAAPADLPVLGTAKGTLTSSTGTTAVVAEILQVRADPDGTIVTWRIKSPTDQKARSSSFQLSRPPLDDTRLLGVVDPATHTTYRAYTYAPAQGDGSDTACLCSDLPTDVDGGGELMYALVPTLPDSVKTVDVTLPGFATVTGIGVDRGDAGRQ